MQAPTHMIDTCYLCRPTLRSHPGKGPPLTQVTCGSCVPRGAKAEAADGITGHTFVTVTLLLAALSKIAWLAPWWETMGSVFPSPN